MTSPNIQRTLEAVWRMESPKLIAALARRVGDVGLAEDLAQDAFVIALQQWPEAGIPPNPGAWLMSTANHRAIDRLRRDQTGRPQVRGPGHPDRNGRGHGGGVCAGG